MRDNTRRQAYAHRLAAEHWVGSVDGQIVCHHCDTPLCVNPDHLFIGTVQDNSTDMVEKGRHVPVPGERSGAAKLKREEVLLIRQLHAEGCVRVDEIAQRFSVSPSTIHSIASGNTWSHIAVGSYTPRVPRGEASGNTRLSNDDVRSIRAAYDAGGIWQKDLAKQYGCSQQTIQRIVRRKSWKHID